MHDLSVLVPARNEEWLLNTIQDVLQHAELDTEVIVILDGALPVVALPQHPKVTVVYHPVSIGQRAATNEAARLATGRYLMKLDAHCSMAHGFDRVLCETDEQLGRPDVTQIPAMTNLHAFCWQCPACKTETYQGPTPVRCGTCGHESGGFTKVLIWQPRQRHWATSTKPGSGGHVRTEFWRLDQHLKFQYHGAYGRRPEAQGEIVDVMSAIGACFFMRRDRFFELGGLDEKAGSWGSFGASIALKSWLSGGRHVVTKTTSFSHLFRTQGGDFGFPYNNPNSAVEHARYYISEMFMNNAWPGQVRPLSWLIEKFAPLPGWHDPEGASELAHVTAAGAEFLTLRRGVSQSTVTMGEVVSV